MLLYVDAQYASPYAMSAFVALREKDIEFELKTLDLSINENREASYRQLSITQRVPTLVTGDFALSESSAIAEYVDEISSGVALYPSDAQQRARVRQVQAWLRSDFLELRKERSTEVVFYRAKAKPLSSGAQVAAHRLISGALGLLPNGTAHIAKHWSIADVDLALMLNRLVLNGDTMPLQLQQYAETQWQRDSIQEWVSKARPPLLGA
jgi:glutathione S-transferase